MNFGKTFKKVMQTKEGKVSLVLVVVGCGLAFLFANVIANRSIGNILQVLCCLVAVFATQQFGRIVMQVQSEDDEDKKK